MGWLIFFISWILFLWLYRYSERHKQQRVQLIQENRHSDYASLKRDFDQSMELFNSTNDDFNTRLTHIDSAIGYLERMEEILPGKENLEAKLPQLLALKQALTHSDIKRRFQETMKKAREATLLVVKVNYATAAQVILSDGLKMGLDKKTLASEIQEANDFANQIQYDEYLAKAKKEEEKGNLNKAIDQYQVAIYFLKMTSMGSEKQEALVKEIEAKIETLYK